MDLSFISSNDLKSGKMIIKSIEKESKIKFKKNIIIEGILVNNYDSAIKVALYYVNLNNNIQSLFLFYHSIHYL